MSRFVGEGLDVRPVSEKANCSAYEVQNGDNLWQIARRTLSEAGMQSPSPHETNLELQRIVDANQDLLPQLENPAKKIFPGMHLNIPSTELVIEPLSYGRDGVNLQPQPPMQGDKCDRHEEKRQVHSQDHHGTRHQRHHYLHGLHKLEKGVLNFSMTAIDNLHHWLDAIAAKAFLLAEREAEADGVHIQISSAGRTFADQSRLYRQLHGHSPVALPGTSNHETGLAVDVTNWRQAKPYLLAHGFVHGDGHGPLKNDPWHFKFAGERGDV